MIKKLLISAAAVSAAAISAALFSIQANAATVDEVAEVARSYGYSEEDIQAGYNEYYSHPEDFPPERLDKAIAYLHQQGSQLITTGAQITTAAAATTTEADVTTAVQTSEQSQQTTQAAQEVQDTTSAASSEEIVLTDSSGNQFTRIGKTEFINMTYDEKIAYVATFTPEQQQIIIDNLSPEEYRSLLKQAPTETKVNVVDSMSEFAEEMGLSISVEDISDESLTIAMKNSDGELVSIHDAGTTVEDTGYDRRGLFAAAVLLFAAAGTSLWLMIRNNFERNVNEK